MFPPLTCASALALFKSTFWFSILPPWKQQSTVLKSAQQVQKIQKFTKTGFDWLNDWLAVGFIMGGNQSSKSIQPPAFNSWLKIVSIYSHCLNSSEMGFESSCEEIQTLYSHLLRIPSISWNDQRCHWLCLSLNSSHILDV